VESGKEFVGAHRYTHWNGLKDHDLGVAICDTCYKSESDGNHIPMPSFPIGKESKPLDVHEYEAEALINWPDERVAREFCGVCGKPEKDRLHFHEFKLVFGGYNCQICGGLISDDVHTGVDPEGITERPVRELVETKSSEEFWVDEDKKVRPRIFGRNKDGMLAIHYLPEEVINIDELVDDANEVNYFNDSHAGKVYMSGGTPIKITEEKPKSRFSLGDKVVLGALGSGLAVNLVISIYNIIN
jgi:hypothetical protein